MTKFFHFSLSAVAVALAVAANLGHAQGLRATPGLAAQLGGAAATNAQRSADYVVAVVNSEPITYNEVRARVLRVEQQLSQRGGALPTRQELESQVLERLISERAQVQLARDNGIKIEDSVVDTAVLNVARQNQVSIDELRRRLEVDGISHSQFRENLRNEILLARVREREVEGRVSVSEVELDAYIREQQDSPDASALEINLGHILVAVPEDANPAQVQALQARAERAAQRARAGEDFALLAREFSDSPERSNGGLLGLRAADRYPPLFVDAVQGLGAGSIAGPLRSGAGFHVLKLVEKKLANAAGVTVTQSRARHILLRVSAQMTESTARARLLELRQSIATGQTDFATAARDNSQDGSAKEGGDLGWANPGQFVPEFEEAMNALAPGQMSAPLVSRFGVHLIQLQERRDTNLGAREQRELARGALREKKAEEAYITWSQEVRSKAFVEMRQPPN